MHVKFRYARRIALFAEQNLLEIGDGLGCEIGFKIFSQTTNVLVDQQLIIVDNQHAIGQLARTIIYIFVAQLVRTIVATSWANCVNDRGLLK